MALRVSFLVFLASANTPSVFAPRSSHTSFAQAGRLEEKAVQRIGNAARGTVSNQCTYSIAVINQCTVQRIIGDAARGKRRERVANCVRRAK
jgi:hypothetical protein